MIKNYFKIAWRNLRRNKIFSAINILGLSAGLACCVLIFLFIQYEFSYDKFHRNEKNIYRIISEGEGPDGRTRLAVSPAPWAPFMKKDFPEIRSYTRLLKAEKTDIGRPGEKHFHDTGLLYADSTFFDVFSVELEAGTSLQALSEPNSIVLTRETAERYFGNEDPLGKTLEVNTFVGQVTVQVTAIAKSFPPNSHFRFNSLVSMHTLGDMDHFWGYHMFHSYLLLKDNSSARELERKFPAFVEKHIIQNPKADGKYDIRLQPLASIHLYSDRVGELAVNGDINYIYVFAGIAIFILLIACFNFTNLSMARSLTRAKEVGLRKVAGADRLQLFRQFLGETIWFAFLSMILSVILVFLVLPEFNRFAERQLSLDLGHNYGLMLTLILLVITVGVLAGFYPAAILSGFRPVEILKGKFVRSDKGAPFRKFLVTLQFTVSIGLIGCTLLVNRQLNFLRNKKTGFDKENVLVVTLPKSTDLAKMDSFRTALQNESSILEAGASSEIPGVNIPVNLVNDGSSDLSRAYSMQMLFVDQDFVKTMKMKMIAGRSLARDYPTDETEGFIINEEAVEKMGWQSPDQAIGKTIQWILPDKVLKKGKVLGVVENFNINPLKSAVQPLVMHYSALRFQYFYIRFNQGDVRNITEIVEKKFNEFYPQQSFEYNFLDENIQAMYRNESRLQIMFSSFSFLAILICSLGILGLSLYSIQQKTMDIGIRKVLGASVLGITTGLLKEFIKPVLIASVVATPVAWYAMNKWLQDFAYRISIEWWIFAFAGLVTIVIALLTVSFQAIKAAMANPVKALRTE